MRKSAIGKLGVLAGFAAASLAARSANPIFTDTFTADPAPIVVGDTCYVITTQDENDGTPGQWLIMNNWRAYSSKDMKSWTCHGKIMDWSTYSWGGSDSWASQVVKGADGKFYHYTTLVGKFDMGYGCRCTGVSVSDTPIGPWKDAIGKPLVKDSDTPSPYGWDDIDPTILIDDDGTVWMAWGNPVCYLAKLKKNMVEIDGEIKTMPLPNYTEGPWLFKRNGIYYLAYVSHNHLGYGEKVSYATAKSMEGPWTYRGLLCENPGGGSFGIHPGICQFKGQWYFFYFNAGLQIPGGLHGDSNRRSVCADYMYFNPDGSIRQIEMTKRGLEDDPIPQSEIDASFKPVKPVVNGCADGSLVFTAAGETSTWKSFEEMRNIRWERGDIALATGDNLYYDFPEYATHRHGWGGAERLAQTFKVEKDITLEKIALFLGNGDGTDEETTLEIRLFDLGGAACPNADSYECKGEDMLGGRAKLTYAAGFRGQANIAFADGKGPMLREGHVYVVELVAKKNTSPVVWFASRDDKFKFGAAYRDGKKITKGKDNKETIDFGMAVYGKSTCDGASVRYRGVFINDEDWGLRPWCKARFGKERGICAEAYREIFADMKSRGVNLLWPAMHPGAYEFVSRKENMDAAREAGITIGTSHCEPMLRNNCYWNKKELGVWDYLENKSGIDAYWKWSVDNYGDYDCLWTIGIRGIHDEGMKGPKDVEGRIKLMEDVFAAQKAMLGPKRPTVFCPYKEVLLLYDAGLKVPDDTTLLWVDDNFGYCRRLGGPKAEGRRQGIYWHASYFGGPHSYTHVCTTPPAFMWYQLVARCWENGVRDMWVVNVGDYYPADVSIYALGQLGANPAAWGVDSHKKLLSGYVASLGMSGKAASRTVRLLDKYYRLGWTRKPELMSAQWAGALPKEERAALDAQYAAFGKQLDDTLSLIPKEKRDRFFAIHGYSARLLVIAGRYFMAWADADGNDEARQKLEEKVRSELAALDNEVSSVEGGFWKNFWWDTTTEKRQETRWFSGGKGVNGWASQMQWPWNEPEGMRPKDRCTVYLADPWIAAAKMRDAADCVATKQVNGGGWKEVYGLGASYRAMALLPVRSGVGKGAEIAFEIEAKEGEKALVLQFLPDMRLYPGEKLRVEVSVNGGERFAVEVPGSDGREDENGWTRRYAVQDGFIRTAKRGVLKPGKNRVTVYGLDAGVVLDKIGVR